MTLLASFSDYFLEAGVDEAGRGCLAGPVVVAAVILDPNNEIQGLNDSKKLTEKKRYELAESIKSLALDYSVSVINHDVIDKMNILKATFKGMNESVINLKTKPQLILIDGNRFINQTGIKHQCIVKGDEMYQSIAAASILAKTTRDRIMENLHQDYPSYNFAKNKGYPTKDHRDAISRHGLCHVHRKTFQSGNIQLSFF